MRCTLEFIIEEAHQLAWNTGPSSRLIKLCELNAILSLICKSPSETGNHNNVHSGKSFSDWPIIITNHYGVPSHFGKKKYKVPILHLVVATSNFVNILYISITAITSLTLTL